MRVLIFDTETSDFPEDGGRLIQFAGQICDLSFDPPLVTQEFSTLVKCTKDSHPRAFSFHGITKEMSQAGIDPELACAWLAGAVDQCDLVVAHNAAFDIRVMDIEFREAGLGGFSPPKVFCTMKASTDLCKLPGKKDSYKFPRLEEALPILCGIELEGGHDALVDTRACKELFIELVRRGALEGPGWGK